MEQPDIIDNRHALSSELTHPVAVSSAVLKAGIALTLAWSAFAVFLNAPTLVIIGITSSAGFVSALLMHSVQLHTLARCMCLITGTLAVSCAALVVHPGGNMGVILVAVAGAAAVIFSAKYEKILFLMFTFMPVLAGVALWSVDTTTLGFQEVGEDIARQYVAIPALLTAFVLTIFEVGYLAYLMENERQNHQRAREKAEAANRIKSEFVANVSHGIRTPLNGVLGLAYLVMDSDLTDQQREHLHKVYKSTRSLVGIIDEILDFSKMEAGKLQMEHVAFSLNTVIEDVESLIKHQADVQQVAFQVCIDPDVPAQFIGDPLRLNQTLVNLSSNAIKFSDEGGRVVLRVGLESKTPEQAILHFSVEDNGIGISPEQQENLFQAFGQADSLATRQHNGTGLGLVISKKIVEAMGGKIWVDSAPGMGSTFHFTAPLIKQPGEPAPETALSGVAVNNSFTPGLKGKRVLLVEDNDVNVEVARAILSEKDITVETAFNGLEALEKLKHNHYDAIFMDCQMPVMDGYETTRQIRSQPKYRKLPIIAMTANAMKGDREKVLAVGMNDYIAKPLEPHQLFEALAKWIEPSTEAAISGRLQQEANQ